MPRRGSTGISHSSTDGTAPPEPGPPPRTTSSRRPRSRAGTPSPNARRTRGCRGEPPADVTPAPPPDLPTASTAKNTPHPRPVRKRIWLAHRTSPARARTGRTPTRWGAIPPTPDRLRRDSPPHGRAVVPARAGGGCRNRAGLRPVAEFAVWAPLKEEVRAPGRQPGARDGARPRRLVAGGRRGRRRRRRVRLPARRRRDAAARPRSRWQPDGVHGRRGSTTTTRSSGPTAPGPAASCPAACSTSCTSARSPPAAPSTPRSSGSTTSSRWAST